MKAKALAIRTETRNIPAIMVFILFCFLLVFVSCKGIAGAGEWKFTPSEQQEMNPVTRAAVSEFRATKNCSVVRLANGETHPCNMQNVNFKEFTIDLPTELPYKWNPIASYTKEENAANHTRALLDTCRLTRGVIGHSGGYPFADLSGVDFTGARVCNLKIQFSTMWDAKFIGAHLYQLDFTGANLTGADFSNATFGLREHTSYMGKLDFAEANLHNVKFNGATFIGTAYFRTADLTGADFTGVKTTRGADNLFFFEDTKLEGAIWLDGTVCQAGSTGKCLDKAGVDKIKEFIDKTKKKPVAKTSGKKKKNKK